MASYESFYPGADNILNPKYNRVGYETNVSSLGMSLDARTANQLGELRTKLNPGQKSVEVQGISAAAWESVPEEHIDEMRRALKLAGVSPSFHAPIIEASGVGEKGWDETIRESAERQLVSAINRAQRLDPNGNISVTVHSTAQLPEMIQKSKTKEGEKITAYWVVNPETGKFTTIEPEKRYFPEDGKFEPGKQKDFNPEKERNRINEEMWLKQLSDINQHARYGERILESAATSLFGERKTEENINKGFNILQQLESGTNIDNLSQKEGFEKQLLENARREANHGRIYLRDSYQNLKSLFNNTYKNVTEEDKKKLDEFANWAAPIVKEGIENDPNRIEDFRRVIERGVKVLGEIRKAPEAFKPLNDFVIDKSATTFANVATEAYNKYKDKAPILNIENPPAGGGLSRAEDLKKVIEESRKKFAENLIQKGTDKNEAKKLSEKFIGATWDVGHINMIRKQGYSEQDVINETKTIAPFVNHVHLSDNFGFEHTELPMGMGNVPIKEMLEKLPKKDMKKIIEAGNWWQYFAEQGGGNPFNPTISAFDSPIYAMKQGNSWSQAGGYGAYSMGQGAINPAVHHSIYGSGFSGLPIEMGGQIGGNQDRFSGTPMQ